MIRTLADAQAHQKHHGFLPREVVAAAGAAEKRRRNENRTDLRIQGAKPERDQAPALESTDAGEASGVRRTRVRFTGYRVRPLDPDNFAGGCKDLLDGLRHSALIPGDAPWQIVFETVQVKVGSFAEEKTVIVIDNPNAEIPKE